MSDTVHLKQLVDRLEGSRDLSNKEFTELLLCEDSEAVAYLAERARAVREKIYGKEVYLRGLIEFTNYCKNNCKYCGIRCGNKNADASHNCQSHILGDPSAGCFIHQKHIRVNIVRIYNRFAFP